MTLRYCAVWSETDRLRLLSDNNAGKLDSLREFLKCLKVFVLCTEDARGDVYLHSGCKGRCLFALRMQGEMFICTEDARGDVYSH